MIGSKIEHTMDRNHLVHNSKIQSGTRFYHPNWHQIMDKRIKQCLPMGRAGARESHEMLNEVTYLKKI